MSLTTGIVINAVLVVGLIGSMLWLLGHHGIRKGVRHDLRLIRRQASPAARRLKRDAERDLAA